MAENNHQSKAWQNQLSEEWMVEYNALSEEMLNMVRMKILAAYSSLKLVELECNLQKGTMLWTLQFKFMRGLGKRKKIMHKLHKALEDKFNQYAITVQIV